MFCFWWFVDTFPVRAGNLRTCSYLWICFFLHIRKTWFCHDLFRYLFWHLCLMIVGIDFDSIFGQCDFSCVTNRSRVCSKHQYLHTATRWQTNSHELSLQWQLQFSWSHQWVRCLHHLGTKWRFGQEEMHIDWWFYCCSSCPIHNT